LHTDACKEGLGGILTKNEHLICYESIKLKEHERKNSMHDLELEIVLHVKKMWRNYLIGRKFELRTNHNGLEYSFGKPTLNARQTRWLEFIREYDFDIKHIKRK
jgi:hypothetical protein